LAFSYSPLLDPIWTKEIAKARKGNSGFSSYFKSKLAAIWVFPNGIKFSRCCVNLLKLRK
jgi:hypothetical protein